MQQKSFEEELNKKTEDFSLTPREGLWEEIEVQLVPVKRKRRVLWLWMPAGLLLIGALAYFNNTGLLKSEQSVSKNTGPHKTFASSVNENVLSANDKVLNGVEPVPEKPINNVIPHSEFKAGRFEKRGDIQSTDRAFMKENSVVQNGNNPSAENNAMQSKSEDNMVNPAIARVEVTDVNDCVAKSDLPVTPDDTSKKNAIAVAAPVMPVFGRFYMGVIMSGIYSKSILTMGQKSNQSANGNPQMDYNNRKETDKSIPGFGVGINGGYIKGRHHFYTGMYYQVMGYQLLVKNVERQVQVVGSVVTSKTMFVPTDSFVVADNNDSGVYFTNRFHYLSIPVGYTFNVIDKTKFSLGLTGNLSYNLLLSSNVMLYDEQSNYYMKKENIKDNKLMKSNFMMAFGCELSYRLNEKCALTLRPQYGFSLNPVEKTAINTGLRYFGLGLGARWYLK